MKRDARLSLALGESAWPSSGDKNLELQNNYVVKRN